MVGTLRTLALALTALTFTALGGATARAYECGDRCHAFATPGSGGGLTAAADGTILYATNGAIVRVAPGAQSGTPVAAPGTTADSVIAASGDALWSTTRSGLSRLEAGGPLLAPLLQMPFAVTRIPGGIAFTTVGFAGFRFDTGQLAMHLLPGLVEPGSDIASSPDGDLYALLTGQRIARINPVRGIVGMVRIPIDRPLRSITAGPDGAMWFTSPQSHYVGRLAPDGRVKLFRVAQNPQRIVSGPSRALWFVMTFPGSVTSLVRFTPTGYASFFHIPDGSDALAATTDDVIIGRPGEITRLRAFMGAHPVATRSITISPFTYAGYVRLQCPIDDRVFCAGIITVSAGNTVVARAPFGQRVNDAPTTAFVLNAAGRRAVAGLRTVPVTVTIDQHDQGGAHRVTTEAYTMRLVLRGDALRKWKKGRR
jgi:streptogramin lyase